MEDKGYDILREQIKEGKIGGVYILFGEEKYLRRTYQGEIAQLLIPEGFEEFNYHRVNGKGLSVLELQETVETMPMMAEHTLVEVTDFDIFKLDENGRGQLMTLLTDFPEYCTLIFIYDSIEYKRDGKMKKLCTAIDEHVTEVEFTQQESKMLYKWVRQHFLAAGHDIDIATMDHLLFTCGSMMTNLAPEIEKISAYAKNPNITANDINAVVEPILDARVFDMTDCIAKGKYDDAAHVLGDLLRMQEEPIAILAVIGRELRRIYTARVALDSGKDRIWLKNLWHMTSDYPVKLLLQAARRVDHRWCTDALKKTQVLDRRMKSERGIDSEKELKLFLMELAGS